MCRVKVRFNHKEKYLHRALGVSDEEFRRITLLLREMVERGLTDESRDLLVSEIIEELVRLYGDRHGVLLTAVYELGRLVSMLSNTLVSGLILLPLLAPVDTDEEDEEDYSDGGGSGDNGGPSPPLSL